MTGPLTVGNALEVVVGLRCLQVDTHKLVVDLILDITEQDKSRDNTAAARCLKTRLDVTVPHVGSSGQHGAHRLGRHGQEDVAVVQQRLTLPNPVGLAGIAQVLADILVPVQRVHRVRLVFAHRRGNARVKGERHAGVAAAQAVRADTALVVFCGYPY